MPQFEPGAQTVCRLRPRYAGANIGTWIGFKNFLALAEEAALDWLRQQGWAPGELYHRYGLGVGVVDSSALLPAVLHVDDEVQATVTALKPGRLRVQLAVTRDGAEATALRGTVTLALSREHPAADDPPEAWNRLVRNDAVAVPARPEPGVFTHRWKAQYFHCHFSDRVQHGSYVQALEDVVDRYLADCGLAVPRLLAERGWIPVVSRVRVRLLADAHMDEEMTTAFTVEDVIKDRAFDGRMDCYAGVGSATRHVATAQILHGYAISRGPLAGTLTELDPGTVKALRAARW